jgi:hypothetical protein
MIFCRDRNIIFFKTQKVGGTSFEIALSKYCDLNDIVTPISPEDEETRANLGYQGSINYEVQNRSKKLVSLGVTGDFRNHMTAKEIRQNIGNENFSKSTKISIHREPLDFIVSLYWFQKTGHNEKFNKLSLREWLSIQYHTVEKNYKIAPISGPYSPDIILNYATLFDDIKKVSVFPRDFLETFSSINAKGNRRPLTTKDPIKYLQENNCEDFIPKIIELSNRARSFHE